MEKYTDKAKYQSSPSYNNSNEYHNGKKQQYSRPGIDDYNAPYSPPNCIFCPDLKLLNHIQRWTTLQLIDNITILTNFVIPAILKISCSEYLSLLEDIL